MTNNKTENNKVIITINGNNYDYNQIIQKTVKAPIAVVEKFKFNHCAASGIDIVDNSDTIRVLKTGRRYDLISGYNLLRSTDTATIDVRLMAQRFLDMCEIPSPIATATSLAEKFKNVGFKVMSGNKVL